MATQQWLSLEFLTPWSLSSQVTATRTKRGAWKKSAVDIMAMLKAMKDGEGVCLAAEFLALPDRSEYPGAACCLPCPVCPGNPTIV